MAEVQRERPQAGRHQRRLQRMDVAGRGAPAWCAKVAAVLRYLEFEVGNALEGERLGGYDIHRVAKRLVARFVSEYQEHIEAHTPGTHCTSGCWYSFQQDTTIDGHDCMRLQGWPCSLAEGTSANASDLKEIASEGYMLACMASVMLACVRNP